MNFLTLFLLHHTQHSTLLSLCKGTFLANNFLYHKGISKCFYSILKLTVLGFVIMLIINMLLTYYDAGDILVQLSPLFLISLKNNKRVPNKIKYNVTPKRTMLCNVLRNGTKSLAMQTRDMSCLRGVKFTKKMPQNMINDNNTGHTHVVKETCVVADCDMKKCPSLCDDFKEGNILKGIRHINPL